MTTLDFLGSLDCIAKAAARGFFFFGCVVGLDVELADGVFEDATSDALLLVVGLVDLDSALLPKNEADVLTGLIGGFLSAFFESRLKDLISGWDLKTF